MAKLYEVEILDSTLSLKAPIKVLAPLDNQKHFLKYTTNLSSWGECRFRVGTKDPIFDAAGDILKPFAYHIRIKRSGVKVWQGVIVSNTKRNKDFIEVRAHTYLWLLKKILIRHDAADGNGAEHYRTLKSGTMASVVTGIVNEAKADAGSNNILSTLTIGTVDNPSFPAGFINAQNQDISGQAWTFSDNFQIKFDYRDALYVLESLGTYANFDFELTDNLVFNFKSYIGNKQPNLVFHYGNDGVIEDYELPRDGDKMANFLVGVAADNDFKIIKAEESDNASIATYGKIADVAAFADVKNVNLLRQRLREELRFIATPDGDINIILNEKAYPLGQYGTGDTVGFKIQDNIISVNSPRRIIGTEVTVHVTGKESIRLLSNLPREGQ